MAFYTFSKHMALVNSIKHIHHLINRGQFEHLDALIKSPSNTIGVDAFTSSTPEQPNALWQLAAIKEFKTLSTVIVRLLLTQQELQESRSNRYQTTAFWFICQAARREHFIETVDLLHTLLDRKMITQDMLFDKHPVSQETALEHLFMSEKFGIIKKLIDHGVLNLSDTRVQNILGNPNDIQSPQYQLSHGKYNAKNYDTARELLSVLRPTTTPQIPSNTARGQMNVYFFQPPVATVPVVTVVQPVQVLGFVQLVPSLVPTSIVVYRPGL